MEVVDPATFILGVAELVRLGDAPSIWVPEIATQLERWARRGNQIADAAAGAWSGEAAVEAAARVLHAAGEHRAVDDLRRMKLPGHPASASASRASDSSMVVPSAPGLVPSWVERHLVVSDEHAAQLMPMSFPAAWLGIDFEAHGLAIGLASTLSFAIRWHGDRPAVLWEVHGAPMPLSYGSWSTGQLSGEALWDPVTTLAASTPGSTASAPPSTAPATAPAPTPPVPPPDQSFS